MKHPHITVISISEPTGTKAPSAGFEGNLGQLSLQVEVNAVSASLQTQVDTVSSNLQAQHDILIAKVDAISSSVINFDVAAISGSFATIASVAAISGEIISVTNTQQTQINNLQSSVNLISSNNVSSTPLTTTANLTGSLQAQINSIPVANIFRAEVANISASLQSEIDTFNSSNVTEAQIATISAGLNSRVTTLESNPVPNIFRTEVAGISSVLNNRISTLESAGPYALASDLTSFESSQAGVDSTQDSRLTTLESRPIANIFSADVAAISSTLQAEINSIGTVDAQIANLTGSFATTTFVQTVSGNLSALLATEASSRAAADSAEATARANADDLLTPLTTTSVISSGLNTRIQTLESNPVPDIFRSEVSAISASLQSEISAFTSTNISRSEVVAVSAGLDSRISTLESAGPYALASDLTSFESSQASVDSTQNSRLTALENNPTPDIFRSEVALLTAGLQSKINQIDNLDAQIANLTGSFATNSYVTAVSSNLSTAITNEASARLAVDTSLDSRVSTLESNPIPDIFRSEVVNLSSSLQSEIDAFTATNISRSEIVSISAGLDARITTNSNNISSLQTFDTQVAGLTGSLAPTSFVNTVSGNLSSAIAGEASARVSADIALQSQIDALNLGDITRSEVASISSGLDTRVTNNTNSINRLQTFDSQVAALTANLTPMSTTTALFGSVQTQINNVQAWDAQLAAVTGNFALSSFVSSVSGNVSSAIAGEASARVSADTNLQTQITNIQAWDSQLAAITGSFATNSFVNSVSGSLASSIGAEASVRLASDNNLQTQIDSNTNLINNIETWNSELSVITGSFATNSFVNSVSGNVSSAIAGEASDRISADNTLQTQIDSNTTDISNIQTWNSELSSVTGGFGTTSFVNTVSGNLSSAIAGEASARSAADALLTPLTTTANLTGALQSEIDSHTNTLINLETFDSEVAGLTGSLASTSFVNSVSGTLSTAIAGESSTRSTADASLQTQINSIQTWDSQLASVTASFATNSFVNTVSGNLSTAIANEALTRSTADNSLQNQITTNSLAITNLQTFDSQVAGLTGSLSTTSFVNAVSGNLSTAIASEALARDSADTTLTNNLASETSARINSDNILNSTIASVSATLLSGYQASDAINSAAISTETSDRTAGDASLLSTISNVSGALSTSITSEASTRATADAAINTQVSTLISRTDSLSASNTSLSSNLSTNYYDKTTSDGRFVHLTGDEGITGNKSLTGNLNIIGNLNVSGTTSVVNSQTLSVADNIVTLNSNVTGAPVLDSGIEVVRGTSTDARLIWDETNDYWVAGISGSEGKIWTAGNMGSGSGLDADLLDGHDSTYFATASAVAANTSNISNIQTFDSQVAGLTGSLATISFVNTVSGNLSSAIAGEAAARSSADTTLQNQINTNSTNINNIQTWDSQLATVTGSFATTSFVNSVSGNLSSAIVGEASARSAADALLTPLTTTANLTGSLQNQITNIQTWDSQLASVTGSFATNSSVNTVSGNLSTAIAGEASARSAADTTLQTQITNIQTWDSQLASVTGSFATTSFVNTVSGNLSSAIAGEASNRTIADTNLQTQITNIQTWDSQLAVVTGSWISTSTVANLTGQLTPITTTAAISAGLDSRINSIQTWDSQLAAVTGTWATTTYVNTISGNLSTAIAGEASARSAADALLTPLTTTANLTGSLQSQITNHQTFDSQISGLTGTWATTSYVNTVSGNLSTAIAGEASSRSSADTNLQTQITNIQTWDSQLAAVTGSFATTTYVNTVSGNLSTAIAGEASARGAADALLTPLVTTANLTGSLQGQINTNTTNINNIQTFESQVAGLTGSFTPLTTTANISSNLQSQINSTIIPLYYDEFLVGATIGTTTATPWVSTVSTGTAVVDNTLTVPGHHGILSLTANSGGTTRFSILNLGNLNTCIADANLTFLAPISVPISSDTTNPYQIRFGFGDLNTNADMNNGAYFEYTHTTSANWICKVAAGGVRQTSTSSIPVTFNTFNLFKIQFDSTVSSVNFYINNTLAANINTGLPSGTSQAFSPFIQIKRVTVNGNANRSVYCDYIKLQIGG